MTRRWAAAANWLKNHSTNTEVILRLDLVSANSEDEARGKVVEIGAKANPGFMLNDVLLLEITP